LGRFLNRRKPSQRTSLTSTASSVYIRPKADSSEPSGFPLDRSVCDNLIVPSSNRFRSCPINNFVWTNTRIWHLVKKCSILISHWLYCIVLYCTVLYCIVLYWFIVFGSKLSVKKEKMKLELIQIKMQKCHLVYTHRVPRTSATTLLGRLLKRYRCSGIVK
jgi:hypothetical protein